MSDAEEVEFVAAPADPLEVHADIILGPTHAFAAETVLMTTSVGFAAR